MRTFEKELLTNNIKLIAGTDEVGRGPLAGPLVAAAVILPNDFEHPLIRDSKTLSKKQLLEMNELIMKVALSFSIVEVSVKQIDKLNVKNASKYGMKRAIESLAIKPEHVLVDFETLDIKIPQTGITKGDSKSISIAAASIIAKVHRDYLMTRLSKSNPKYFWDSNAGYGTKKHLEAIQTFGYTKHHRKSFDPYKSYLKNQGN